MNKQFASIIIALIALVISAAKTPAANLAPGDILVADSQGAILKVTPGKPDATMVSSGGNLVRPYQVAVEPDGNILVTDTGAPAIIRINPRTGSNTIVSSGNHLGAPFGITLDPQGNILVANAESIIRVDPQTGDQTVVATGDLLHAPIGVAAATDGHVFVADATGAVIEVDPATGAQTTVSVGQHLVNPAGIAIGDNGDLLVADQGAHGIVRINRTTRIQEMVSAGGNLVTPVSVAVGAHRNIVVGDPDAFGLSGGVIQLDASSDTQSDLYVGSGDLVNPRGIAIVSMESSMNQLTPCAGPVSGGVWKNHKQYVSAVRKLTRQFLKEGSISRADQRLMLNEAQTSTCGADTGTN